MTMQDQLQNVVTVKDRAKRKLERDAREILSALQDPETVEIMVNADGCIWQEKLGQKIQHIGNLQAAQTEAVLFGDGGFEVFSYCYRLVGITLKIFNIGCFHIFNNLAG